MVAGMESASRLFKKFDGMNGLLSYPSDVSEGHCLSELVDIYIYFIPLVRNHINAAAEGVIERFVHQPVYPR
jgi:hypothetical protein